MKPMEIFKTRGSFIYNLGESAILIKWEGRGQWWPDEEAGPGFWDPEVTNIMCEMIGFNQYEPRPLYRYDMADDIYELIAEKAHEALVKVLPGDIAQAKIESPRLIWPDEVPF